MNRKITRLYTGPDGESHFADIEIPLDEANPGRYFSAPMKATSIVFGEMGSSYPLGWHNAPRRQFVIILSGGMEIEVGDGTKRKLGAGEILLAEDLTGRGHVTRNAGNKPRRNIVVTLD